MVWTRPHQLAATTSRPWQPAAATRRTGHDRAGALRLRQVELRRENGVDQLFDGRSRERVCGETDPSGPLVRPHVPAVDGPATTHDQCRAEPDFNLVNTVS